MVKRNVILFVCTGNTCRSPIAEGLLRDALKKRGSEKQVEVLSAGTAAWEGDEAAYFSKEVLKEIDIDIDTHRSQPLTQELIDKAFAIFYMSEGHKAMIEANFKNLPEHFYAVRELLKDGPEEVPDPFGQDLEVYQVTRDSIQEAIPSILEFLNKKL